MINTSNVSFKISAAAALLLASGLLLWIDKATPLAGVWVLLLLSISFGFIHGALDAVLLPQRFASRAQAAFVFVAYLLLVLLLGWLLGSVVSLALWVLLLMSAWHFGEAYGRWNDLSVLQSGLTRIVVGGASVMLPMLLAPEKLATILTQVVPVVGFKGWQILAWVWLALTAVWLLRFGVTQAGALRYAWLELLGCVLLFGLFSPLMAFALYFGAYHAPVHIWRVWRASSRAALAGSPKISTGVAIGAAVLTTALSWLLGAVLWWFLAPDVFATPDIAAVLRWLIVAFAALTAPHLVLISLCAPFLTEPGVDR